MVDLENYKGYVKRYAGHGFRNEIIIKEGDYEFC